MKLDPEYKMCLIIYAVERRTASKLLDKERAGAERVRWTLKDLRMGRSEGAARRDIGRGKRRTARESQKLKSTILGGGGGGGA